MAYVFVDDDAGFVLWRDEHSSGYIVNAARRSRPDYLILHRADCGHLASPHLHNWTKDHIKICSNDVNGLIRWAEREAPGYRELQACRTRDP